MENQSQLSGIPPEKAARVRWTIWGALLFSVFLYGGVGFFAAGVGTAEPDPNFLNVLFIALCFVSVFTSTAVLFLLGRFMSNTCDFITYCIVRWAMSESIAIFGLVLALMGAQARPLIFYVWSAMLMILTAPSTNNEKKFQMAKDRAMGKVIG